jgi:hypothetical protein
MRKPLAAFLALLGLSGAATAAPPDAHATPSAALRQMALQLAPADIGLSPMSYPHEVWGLLTETGLAGGYYTLVVLGDGSTSLYFSNGGGSIGAGAHERVRAASQRLLAAANDAAVHSAPAAQTPPPPEGETRFYFLTFRGVRMYAAPEAALAARKDPLSGLFDAGQAVIAAIRELPP